MAAGLITDLSRLPDTAAIVLGEHAFWATLCVAGVIGGTQIYQFYLQRQGDKKRRTVAERQATLDSARLTLELLAELRTKEFRKCQDRVIFQDPLEGSEELLAMRTRYLDHFNTICGLYYNDRVLKKHHVSENFGAMLDDIGRHQETVEYLYDDRQKPFYRPLKRWLGEEVKISPP